MVVWGAEGLLPHVVRCFSRPRCSRSGLSVAEAEVDSPFVVVRMVVLATSSVVRSKEGATSFGPQHTSRLSGFYYVTGEQTDDANHTTAAMGLTILRA